MGGESRPKRVPAARAEQGARGMFWPFKRKPRPTTVWDEAARNLVAQGLDPKKVRRATNLVKKLTQSGTLPFDPETGERRLG
jgi:hypothetical protein